jgi:small subunit ribosomal protein S13
MSPFNIIKKKVNLSKAGVGFSKLEEIYKISGLNFKKAGVVFRSNKKKMLRELTNKLSYSDSLKFKMKKSIEFYTKLKNYRGVRHLAKYPVRGQRTHTNAKTVKRKRKQR